MKAFSTRTYILLALILLMLVPAAAWAYIDPGTGSFVIQGIIGAIVGGAFAIKLFWRRIKAALTGKSLADDEDLEEDDDLDE